MRLFVQELAPQTDDVEENTTLIHGYDPNTFLWEWTAAVDEDTTAGVDEDNNTTRVPMPDYSPFFEKVKFNTSTQLWEIIAIENALGTGKIAALSLLNVEFARTLKKISSPIAQSSGLYEMKYKESMQYKEDGSPTDLSNYPLLETGVIASGMSAEDYANLTISKHDEYANKLINIEKIRLQANVDINAVEYDASVKTEVLISKIDNIVEMAIDALFNL